MSRLGWVETGIPTEMGAPEIGGFVRVTRRFFKDTPAGFANHVLKGSE
jgi:hypothetical protein